MVKRQVAIGLQNGLQRTEISNASSLATYLERAGNSELAKEVYETFAVMLKDAKDEQFRKVAESFAGSARRLGLLGNAIEIEGKLTDDSEFNWSEYRGNVVSVDFWATWCGPCIAGASNVVANYKKYHPRAVLRL